MHVSANVNAQSSKFNIDLKQVSIEQLLEQIQEKCDCSFLYRSDLFDNKVLVNIDATEITVEEVLDKFVVPQGFSYTVMDNHVILFEEVEKELVEEIIMEQIKVKGKVTDKEGKPLPGATITEKGTINGTISDLNGNYSLNVTNSNSILKATYMGFEPQEVSVGAKTLFNFVLKSSASKLDEVVIISTGYQDLPADRPTGSFSKITAKQLSSISSNILDKMEGLAPGLTIYKTGRGAIGNQTDDNDFFIRGISTFSEVSPLIVVDGFPLEDGSNIYSINPNDIETMTLLKDAAASSIYGLRSANGVIVITTKKGAGNKIRIGYRTNYTFGSTPDLSYIKRLSAKDQVSFEEYMFSKLPEDKKKRERDFFGGPEEKGYSKVFGVLYDLEEKKITSEEARKNLDKLASYDNTKDLEKAFMNNVFELEHDINISGTANNNKLNYYVSFNHVNKDGIYKADNNKINKFNVKLSYKFLNDKLKIDLKTNIRKNIGSISPLWREYRYKYRSLGQGNLLPVHLKINPYEHIRDENGNPSSVNLQWSPEFLEEVLAKYGEEEYWTPLNDLTQLDIKNKELNTYINLSLQYHLLDGMYLELGGYITNNSFIEEYLKSKKSYYNRNIRNYYTDYTLNWDTFAKELGEKYLPEGDIITQTNTDKETKFLRAQIVFNKYLDTEKNHHFNFLLGGERKEYIYKSLITNMFGYDKQSMIFKPIDFKALINFQTNMMQSNLHGSKQADLYSDNVDIIGKKSVVEDRFVSFYTNFNYMLKNRYIFSGSIRIDQSNHFGTDPKHRYVPIWSAGFRWKIHQESFLNVDWIQRLFFRVTYGFSGNKPSFKQASSKYILSRKYNNEYQHFFNTPIIPKNSGLRKEITSVLNFGLDFDLFNEKLNGSLDVYRKNTTDVLSVKVVDPTKTGFYKAYLNDANIVNRGIDLNLELRIINTKNFKWLSTINASYNSNIVKKVHLKDASVPNVLGKTFNAEGFPVRSLFALKWKGINDKGESVVLGPNGKEYMNVHNISNKNYNEIKTMDFYVHKGTVIPTHTIGLHNVFWYKNFELSFLLVYSGGNVMLSDRITYRIGGTNAVFPTSTNFWKKKGDEKVTDLPLFKEKGDNTFLRNYADINYEDASFLKLRRVMLTYDLAKALGEKLPFSYCKIKLQGRDLASWFANNKGIDPETYIKPLGKRTIAIQPTFSLGIDIKF
jgi:TonB-linked SusC/RagA family outer membrane protein